MPSDNPYDDHDFRLIHPADKATYSLIVDFDPTPVEPDPRVYPLWYDKGNVGSNDLDQLIPMYSMMGDTATAVWISPSHYEGIYRRRPSDGPNTDLDPRELPAHKRPGVTLSGDLKEGADRMVRLWNGEFVNGTHVILDKIPRPTEFLGSIPTSALDPLHASLTEHEQQLQNAFGDYPWFDISELTDAHLQTKHILRRQVSWAPTLKGKKMLHRHPDLPAMTGDSLELLPHRVGVGTTALHLALTKDADINTYVSFPGGYNVDLGAHLPGARAIIAEVMTGHHNMDLHLSTFRKLWTLSQKYRFEPWLVFDSRTTLRWIINYWLEETGLDPGPSLNSEPQLDNFNEQLQAAYNDPNRDWEIARATTISRLWNKTFGPDGVSYSRENIKSIEW